MFRALGRTRPRLFLSIMSERKRHRTERLSREEVATLTNESLVKYYRDVQRLVVEDEWDAFMTAMRSPLPTSFRLSRCSPLLPL